MRVYFTGYSGCEDVNCVGAQFFVDTNAHRQIKKMFKYKNFTEDLIQDVVLWILTYKNQEYLMQLCKTNKFNFWLFSVLKTQRQDKKSKTNRQYSNPLEFFPEYSKEITSNDYENIEKKEHLQYIISLLNDEIGQLNDKKWYDSRVFINFLELKKECDLTGNKFTFDLLSKRLNINAWALYRVIKNVQEKLRNKYKNELY